MSIIVQSISLSVSASVVPWASPTSVSVKLLTPCQQWRRAHLDPCDGWVLVDLSHANIFSESAERGAARVCQPIHPHTCTFVHTSIRDQVPKLRQLGAPDTPVDSVWTQMGGALTLTVTGRGETHSRFFFLQIVYLTHILYMASLYLTSCSFNKPEKLTLPAHPKGNMQKSGENHCKLPSFSFSCFSPKRFSHSTLA